MSTTTFEPAPRPRDDKPRRRWWAYFGANSLALSILIHVLFGVGATYLIVEHFTQKHINFHASEPPAPQQVEHKVQLARRNNQESAPPDLKRIVSTAVSDITLPEPPDISTPDVTTPSPMAGVDGTLGLGDAMGGGGGSGGGSGGALPVFGAPNGNGMEGNFFDFTRDQNLKPVDPVVRGPFRKIISDFVKEWKPGSHVCYASPNVIRSPRIFVPVIPDSKAGMAFQSPESSDADYLIHYHVTFVSTQSGQFQFLGWGDNVMIVAIDKKIVLDASDHQTLHESFSKNVGSMKIVGPGKSGATPIFSGDTFTLGTGQIYQLDVLIGDAGGVITSGLFIRNSSSTLTFAENGAPKVPLFVIGTLPEADQKILAKDLPPECFTPEPRFIAPMTEDGN